MITLITAPPGYGKTVHAVWNEIRPAIEKGRLVYTSGIPKLKLPTIPLKDHEVKQWHVTDAKQDPDDPDEVTKLSNIDEGALIVIDEVQRIWRPTGTTVSDDIAGLETHRHHGIDFVILTQHPSLVHRNVRALVGKHIHITSTVLGRKMFEWAEWCENPQTRSQRQLAVKSNYSLPKQGFGLYESASLHIKPQRKMPFQVYVVIAAFVASAFLGQHAISDIYAKGHPQPAPISESKTVTPENMPNASPVVGGQPAEKPKYEYVGVVSPQYDWSSVAACVIMKGECRCYGDNADRLVIPDNVCRAAVNNGWAGRPLPQPSSKPELKLADNDLKGGKGGEPHLQAPPASYQHAQGMNAAVSPAF